MPVRRLRRRLICTLTVLALFLGTIQAAQANGYGYRRVIEIIRTYVHLPGVDHYGNVNHHYGNYGKCKIIINHKRNTCIAVCRGKVQNESNRNQRYYDIGLIPPYVSEGCYWYKDVYRVSRRGRASGLAWGYHDYYYDEEDGGESAE